MVSVHTEETGGNRVKQGLDLWLQISLVFGWSQDLLAGGIPVTELLHPRRSWRGLSGKDPESKGSG